MNLKRLNNYLTIAVIALGIYIIVAPFLPLLASRVHNLNKQPATDVSVAVSNKVSTLPISNDEVLAIPRLDLTETIHTGSSVYELNKGVWLVPHTSSPDQGSNTVIIGHRFTYAGPAVFYFLDKVQLNDRITIDWQHKQYTYQVTSIKVVSPTEIAVQNPTSKAQLTLYTCTPLITAKNRLVITAPLIGVRSWNNGTAQ